MPFSTHPFLNAGISELSHPRHLNGPPPKLRTILFSNEFILGETHDHVLCNPDPVRANIFRSALQIIEGTCTYNRHYSITEIQFKTDTKRSEGPARKLTNYEEKGETREVDGHTGIVRQQIPKGNSSEDTWRRLGSSTHLLKHMGAAGPETPDVEALRLEIAELKQKYEAVLEENKELKAKLAQLEPQTDEKRPE
ncbi:unnamed protein product [Ranitomeya imitator]|uniref:Uncharacterized protein n=1 Tax=Ranitomeya imitator TaxID=111125 RepID=A0ABN9LIB0_9NEOB|nr:unnamed protein product [Ranitomeya imitator]